MGLNELVATAGVAFLFRLLPLSLWAAFTTKLAGYHRVGIVFLAAGLVLAAAHTHPLIAKKLPWVVAYFALIAVPVSRAMAIGVSSGRLSRPAVLICSASAFVVFPSILLPFEVSLIGQVFGWDLSLRAYSYAVDARRPRGLPQEAFFLLVSPVLMVAQQTRPRVPTPAVAGWCRVLLGHLLWSLPLVGMLAYPLIEPSLKAEFGGLGYPAWYLGALLKGGLSALALYAVHAGLAMSQIGLLSLAGFSAPQRYVAPYRATSVLDFWRRWNTWVGGWARTYVFLPVVLRLRRRGWSLKTSYAVSLLVTFGIVGALHDILMLSSPGDWVFVPSLTASFIVFALLALGWDRIAAVAPMRLHGRHYPLLRGFMLLHVLVFMQFVWELSQGASISAPVDQYAGW